MKPKTRKKVTSFLITFFTFLIFLNIITLLLDNNSTSRVIPTNLFHQSRNFNNVQVSAEQWEKESHEEQWIKNSVFNNSMGWMAEINGDARDVDADINNGEAHYFIKGDQEVDHIIISGTINNSLTSSGWINTTNPRIPVYPRRVGNRPLHEINEDGCWTAHIWNESRYSDKNPYQKVSVQWDKNATLPYDMSDYIITSASLSTIVNATVRAYKGYGQDNPSAEPDDPWGGLDVEGDTDGSWDTYFGEGDYIIFFAELSNIDRSVNYRVAQFKPPNLGTDVGYHLYDNITDTFFEPTNTEDLIFYLNQVLEKGDFQNFTITLGIEINCEDNRVCDWDIFEDIYIKTCDFNISYVKKIDQLTSMTWKYQGEPLESDQGTIEVIEAKLFFDYRIDQLWPTYLSPNSEIKVLINDQEHTETIKLSNAETSFKSIKEGGFDVAKLIPTNEEINISIQVFIADEFGLGEEYIITIDNAVLNISYNLYIPAQETLLFEILLIVALVVAGGLTGYFILYQKVLKYPKPVRKTRKYRFTLRKKKDPDVHVIDRESAFKSLYVKELGAASGLIKTKPLKQISKTSKSIKKPSSKAKKTNLSKKALIILFIIIAGLFLMPIFQSLILSNYAIKQNMGIRKLQSNPQISADPLSRKPYTEQWIKNPDFNNTDDWNAEYAGDLSDVNALINNGKANFEILGESGSRQWIENNPLSNEWKRIENIDGIPVPEVTSETKYGWFVRHRFVDNNLNQSVKAQWQKNFTIDVDMSDYYITSASLEMWINGTVENANANNGGIDRPGDTDVDGGSTLNIATGDFARFFVLASDLNHEREFEAALYQTTDLGRDGPPSITQLNNTQVIPITEETLIFYLTEAFKKDSHQFAITLGISIWCEDSVYAVDRDYWNGLWIQNLTLSFSYEKKMNQFTSVEWKYNGDQIEVDNYSIEVTHGRLYFDYKINRTWPTSLSPNSEVKIYINNQVHNESVKLSNAEVFFKTIKIDGFDVTKLIPNDKEINVTIQILLADEFGLSEKIKISIDNVILWISYDVLIPIEETILFQVLFTLACIGAAIVAAYTILYQRVLKYPKTVRKVRKYRKTLRRVKKPETPIMSQEIAFKKSYDQELLKTSKLLNAKLLLVKGKPIKMKEPLKPSKPTSTLLEQKINSEKLIAKSLEKKAELDKLVKDLPKE